MTRGRRILLNLVAILAAGSVLGAADGGLRLLTEAEWRRTMEPESLKAQSVDATWTNAEGHALNGLDPVSFFDSPSPVKGDVKIEAKYGAATYLFRSEKSRAAFEAEPGKFLPQFGGWCAYAMARGRAAKPAPRAWKLVSGRFYFFENPAVMDTWERDQRTLVQLASGNWKVLSK